MITENTFEGIDGDYEYSLKKHGFICRNEKSDQYLCFYKIDDDKYEYGFVNESELDDIVSLKSWMEESRLNDFLKYCGLNGDKFKKLPFSSKAYSMIQYFGHRDIMGTPINPLTYKQAIDMIHNE
jgi:hypothetical protein